jgi:hypothetical protein
VSLMAVERIPQPHEAVGVVSNDLANRTLIVKLSDQANGYTKLLWKEAFQALRLSEQVGWRDSAPTVWASTPDAYQVSHAVTGDAAFGGMLKFTFPHGESAYSKLISKPVTASVWIDRSRNRYINVNFKHAGGRS